MNLTERAKSLGLKSVQAIYERQKRGWNGFEAITITKKEGFKRISEQKKKHFHNGKHISELVKPENLVITRRRIKDGMHPKLAIEMQDVRIKKPHIMEPWLKSGKSFPYRLVRQRVYNGWSMERALTEPRHNTGPRRKE